MLQKQFTSVFSCPDNNNNSQYLNSFNKLNVKDPLTDLVLSQQDIINAISEIKSSSSCPKTEIPARVYKECKATLSIPLQMLWKKSFESGQVPSFYKNQQIVPIFKKGSKVVPENYRPIALTSHSVKIFNGYSVISW